MNYVYVLGTVLLTVYGQIIIKWRVLQAGVLPEPLGERVRFLFLLFLDPWVMSALAAAVLAAALWMAAMTRLPLSHAYPMVSLAFVLVLIASGLFFHEAITPWKIAGTALIVLGIVVGSQG
ncbi:MAG: EamA family transporter [Betaproteobacteria bacterium]|nr:EamA family transporter [Betaproteobacteria bacterium]MDH3436673.1 EamA family transporter [Betaproteobacteria bacterium]